MLRKRSDQLFSPAHLEIRKVESWRDVTTHECVAFRIQEPGGKPRAGRDRSLPTIIAPDYELAVLPVTSDDLYRDG
jgi:hypothetical protein